VQKRQSFRGRLSHTICSQLQSVAERIETMKSGNTDSSKELNQLRRNRISQGIVPVNKVSGDKACEYDSGLLDIAQKE
jgi:hypothetical protein